MGITSKGIEQLKKDEGFTPKASHLILQSGKKEKVRTIGYGYNLNAAASPERDLMESGIPEADIKDIIAGNKAISKEQADSLFQISLDRARADAGRVIPGFNDMDPEVKDVLTNMSYQLGAKGLREFKKMRSALVEEDYYKAAKELLNSKFARGQASARAKRLATDLVKYGNKKSRKTKVKPVKIPLTEQYKKIVREEQINTLARHLSREQTISGLAEAISTMMEKQTTEVTASEGGAQ